MCGWDPSLSRARPVVLWCCGVRRVLWDRVGAPVVGVVVYPPPEMECVLRVFVPSLGYCKDSYTSCPTCGYSTSQKKNQLEKPPPAGLDTKRHTL